jgi:hypothetical protein
MTTSTTKKQGDVKGVASKWNNGSRVHVQRSTSEYGKYIACRHVTVSFTETLFLSRIGIVNVSKLPAFCHLLTNGVTARMAHANCGARIDIF